VYVVAKQKINKFNNNYMCMLMCVIIKCFNIIALPQTVMKHVVFNKNEQVKAICN